MGAAAARKIDEQVARQKAEHHDVEKADREQAQIDVAPHEAGVEAGGERQGEERPYDLPVERPLLDAAEGEVVEAGAQRGESEIGDPCDVAKVALETLPLPSDVGTVLTEYIQHERPQSPHRSVSHRQHARQKSPDKHWIFRVGKHSSFRSTVPPCDAGAVQRIMAKFGMLK